MNTKHPRSTPRGGIVKLRLAAVLDAQHGGFATGWSPVSWGSIDELFVNLTIPVKTLRAAARDGRLPVTYDTRTTFRRLRARATPAAARAFRRSYYGRTVRPDDRRAPLTWAIVPDDYAEQIRALRRARGLSQAQLATLVGAARKAVVYQWEAGKRTPSPVFWRRITALHQ